MPGYNELGMAAEGDKGAEKYTVAPRIDTIARDKAVERVRATRDDITRQPDTTKMFVQNTDEPVIYCDGVEAGYPEVKNPNIPQHNYQ